jgi:hypothetical protein
MSFVSLYFLNFPEMLHYIVIKQADTPVHNCDIGAPLLYKAWRPRDSLFEFQNRIFFDFFSRVSYCSNNKPFEVRRSTVFKNACDEDSAGQNSS